MKLMYHTYKIQIYFRFLGKGSKIKCLHPPDGPSSHLNDTYYYDLNDASAYIYSVTITRYYS